MSRKIGRIVAASLTTLAVVATAGCAAGGSGDGPDGATTIDLWTHAGGNEAELGVINTIVDDFNGSQDDYVVKVTDFPQDAYNDAVVAAATSDSLPCIVDIDGPNVANWAWAGYIQPLGLPDDTWERYALRDVPHQSSVSDRGCECRGQHPIGVPDCCGRQTLVCEALYPIRDIRVDDPGQGYELPLWQDLPTQCDLVADHPGRLQRHLTRQPLR